MTASDDFWQRVLATARDLNAYNYYELFGVDRSASSDQISEAFYRFARAIHPDKHAFEPDPDRQRALVQVYARLHEAFRVLADQQRRQEYDARLAGGEKRHAAAAAQIEEKVLHKRDPATPQGRQALERGVAYLEAGDLPKARAQLQLAKQLEPTSQVIDRAFSDIMKMERRAFPRYELDQRIEVQCATWEQPAVVYIKDVSRSGVFLKSKVPPQPGAKLELKLRLPRGVSVYVTARVTHRIGPRDRKHTAGFGLQFQDLTDDKWAQIEHILPHAKAARDARASQPPPLRKSSATPLSSQSGEHAIRNRQDDSGHSRVSVHVPSELLAKEGPSTGSPRGARLRGTTPPPPRVPDPETELSADYLFGDDED